MDQTIRALGIRSQEAVNGLQPGATLRAAILKEARTWLNVPYLHQGKNRAGVDCIGFVYSVFSKFQDMNPPTNHPDLAYWRSYSVVPDPAKMGAGLRLFFDDIPKEKAKPGDVLWLRRLHLPQHLGIYSDCCGRGIIHAMSDPGRVIETALSDKWWQTKVVSAFRLKGLA